ncbi:MAG: hypothetical protein KatS3mg105_2930 [Gemmatales bacterium]|nr:MAG: hypothetical protein KatS3mg105_2930 [Gemmatales bacterium]
MSQMTPIRQVEGSKASERALGILIPPGQRTIVLLRPRALEYDLLPVNQDNSHGTFFWEIPQGRASAIADEMVQALTEHLQDVRIVPIADGDGYQLRMSLGHFVFVVCPRIAGQPYRPLALPTVAEAEKVSNRIRDALVPPSGADLEWYLNSRHFSR